MALGSEQGDLANLQNVEELLRQKTLANEVMSQKSTPEVTLSSQRMQGSLSKLMVKTAKNGEAGMFRHVNLAWFDNFAIRPHEVDTQKSMRTHLASD